MEAKVLDYHVKGYLNHGIQINDNSTVFDVGANIGVFGVRVMQQGDKTRVFAFEPVPMIYEVLAKNAEPYKDRFIPINAGLSDSPGRVSFQYYPNAPALSTAHPDVWDKDPEVLRKATASQVRNAPPEMWYAKYLPSFVVNLIAANLRKRAVTVNCNLDTISNIIRKHQVANIDLLKVDCEGAEYAVLCGVEKEHWPMINQVVAEVYDLDGRVEKVRVLLEENGFTKIIVEEEEALKGTNLYNVYAVR